MGNLLISKSSSENAATNTESSSKKRKNCDSESEEGYSDICHFNNAKRKKLRNTSNYIYNALFVDGESSDITIRALDHEWNLHRVYLRQAGYFNGMFHGDWKESNMKTRSGPKLQQVFAEFGQSHNECFSKFAKIVLVIDLHIPDNKINEEALNVAFGSLYSDEVVILPSQVVSVLAAASLIQQEGLMQQCSEVMKDAVCCENVCSFYNESRIYGQSEVERTCLKWLENNLMLQAKNLTLLHEIDTVLMTRIIKSPDMFVLQVEMDVYTMLRKWLYLKIASEDEKLVFKGKSEKQNNTAVGNYFREKFQKNGKAFLDTDDGRNYINGFRALRLCNVIRDFSCCLEIEKDGVIPYSWLMPLYRQRWMTMLRIEQGVDRGPDNPSCFDGDCLRCGRILIQDTDYCWRWNGYNFGLDLLITYSSQTPKTIFLKRNIHSQRRIASVGLALQRKVTYHLRLFSLDDKGHLVDIYSAGPSSLTLEKDEEKSVLTIQDSAAKLKFPLLVSATFRVVSKQDMGNSSYKISPLISPVKCEPELA